MRSRWSAEIFRLRWCRVVASSLFFRPRVFSKALHLSTNCSIVLDFGALIHLNGLRHGFSKLLIRGLRASSVPLGNTQGYICISLLMKIPASSLAAWCRLRKSIYSLAMMSSPANFTCRLVHSCVHVVISWPYLFTSSRLVRSGVTCKPAPTLPVLLKCCSIPPRKC